jgi:hypothetical protein
MKYLSDNEGSDDETINCQNNLISCIKIDDEQNFANQNSFN